jgi:cobalt-zinc-cadmium efflux system membrane fusion protein
MNRIRLPEPRLLAASAAVLLLFGCNRNSEHTHDDDHHHGEEPKTAQITVWGERHEIFAEHRFIVANTPTKFVTHVTDLKTLEPRREGPIKFVLRMANDAPVEQVEKEPTRAGIYEAILTFPMAGDWSVSVSIPTGEGEKTVALPPVKVFKTQHDADHGKEQEVPEGISFLKEQQWKIRSKAEPVSKRRLVERVRVPAMVTARPGSLAQVTTPIAGRVLPSPGKTLPMVGDRVEKGQTLALLQPSFSELAVRFAEAEAEVIRARLAVEQADLIFKRTEKLAAAEAKSARELQEMEFALKSAQARLAAALALQTSYRQVSASQPAGGTAQPALELKSPIAGVITDERRTPDGEHVAADTLLFTVLDNASVFIEAKVPEASASKLSTAKGASYELPGEAGKFTSITDGLGRLVFTGLQVDTATRTVPLIFETKNAQGTLRVGQMLNLYIETQHTEDGVAIPDSAIVEEGGQPVAFVQVSGETFQKRELTLGIRDGNWVQVLSGVTEGERVVTKGAMAIRLASASSVIPAHGHAH